MFNQTTSAAKPINQSINQSIRRARAYIYSLVVLCFALALAACVGTSSSPGSGGVVPGTLSIGNYESTTVESTSYSGYTITADITLNGSTGVSGLAPTVTSNDATVYTVALTDPNCTLSTSRSTCQVTITGTGVGNTTFTATAPGGYTATSNSIAGVYSPFLCVADGSTACGCLLQNDGSNLTWYADASQTGTWTNWCSNTGTAADTNCSSTGAGITAFNSGSGHCGYTDWHLPTMAASPTAGEAVATEGGNWGTLGTYAGSNTGAAFATWLSSNGFSGVNTGGFYWSSVSHSSVNAWGVYFFNGDVFGGDDTSSFGVLLVRP